MSKTRVIYGTLKALTPYQSLDCVGATIRQRIWDPQMKTWNEPEVIAWYYAKACEALSKREFLIGANVLLTAHEDEKSNLYGDDLPTSWGMIATPAEMRDHTEADEISFRNAVIGMKSAGLRPHEWEVPTDDPARIEAAVISADGKTDAEKMFRQAAGKLIRQARYAYIGPVGAVSEKNGNVRLSVGYKRSGNTVWNDIQFWADKSTGKISEGGEAALKLNQGDVIVVTGLIRRADYKDRRQFTGSNKPRFIRAKETQATEVAS